MRRGAALLILALLAACGGDKAPAADRTDDLQKLGAALSAAPAAEAIVRVEARLAAIDGRLDGIEKRLAQGIVAAPTAAASAPVVTDAPVEVVDDPATPAHRPPSIAHRPFELTMDLPAEPTNIRLWHSYRGKEKAALEALCEDFNARFAPLHVEAQEVPFHALRDKITVTVPRGTGPDLFVFAHNVIGDWVEKGGILVPLGSYVKNYDSFEGLAERFLPETVKALTYQRSLYAMPLAFKSHALFYNRKLITEVPDTAEQLRATARAATDLDREPDERVYGLVYEAGRLYNHAPWAQGFGAVLMDDQEVPHLDSEEMAASVRFVRSLVEDGSLPPDINDAMVTSMFNDGRAAMVVNGPWFLGEIDPGVDYGVALLPEIADGRRARPFLGSEGIFLTTCAKNPEAAFQVIRYLTSDEAAKIRFVDGRQVVANRWVYEDEGLAGQADPALGVFRAQARHAEVMPSSAKMQPVWSTVDNALKRAIFGGGDVTETLRAAQEKALHDIEMMGK
ncbi:MAG: extracellular solute-binding protein [Pseudomonadota bacterium]